MPLYIKFILGVIAYLLVGIAITIPVILFDIVHDKYDDDDWYYGEIVGWPIFIGLVIIWAPFAGLKKIFDKLNQIVREGTS